MGKHLIGYGTLAVLSAGVIASAQAQQQSTPDTGSDTIEQVNVTATRSAGAVDVQKVPAAITVLQPESLAKFGLGNLVDIASAVPAMSVQSQGPGVNNITMRGLVVRGIVPSEIQDASLVAVYVDDMPVTLKSGNPDLKVLDLERIEVLQGPQGTLFGAGAMAGAVRQITQKPDTNDLFGSVEAVGSRTSGFGGNNHNLRGMVNIPLKDDVAGLRLTGYTGNDSGYIKNALTGGTTNAVSTNQGRAALRLKASRDLTVDASITASNVKAGLNDAYADLAPFTTIALLPQSSNDNLQLYNLAVNYDFGRVQLVSSTSYLHRDTFYQQSAQYPATAFVFGGQLPLMAAAYQIGNKVTDFAQEFRFNSKDAGPFKWTAGAFFESGKRNVVQNEPTIGFDARFAATRNFPGYNSQTNELALTPDNFFSGLQNTKSRQVALFAEGTYTVWDKLDLTAGLRLFRGTQDFDLRFSGLFGNLVGATPTTVGVPETSASSATSQGANPRFAAAYRVDPDHMVYASAGKGFRYGGNNQPVPFNFCGVNAPSTFAPDSLWNYELGSKNTLLDRRMTFNVSVYRIDWSDVQVFNKLPCTYYYTLNAGKIRSQGLEVESAFKLSRHATFGLSASYNDAYARETVVTGIAAQNIPAGSRTPYAPRFAANATLSYSIPVNGKDEVGVSASYAYRGNAYTNFAKAQGSYEEIPSSNMVNATVTYKTGAYEFGLFGTNLTNGTKINDVTSNVIAIQPGNTLFLAQPRTIGLRVKARF
ncbi:MULTISPECIES: TonB-dependent receptor [unclassified Janthinobacterium]|uniref:TonB-dependent receptor n=1 Tax=unclassified Janthinobacterium TaxID=2610881 RepID=UPI001607A21E|nr:MULTISPECIES: TonB-dependent receptor [unclassified Janthinobacterium]MBB5369941.1 outer membrane receptor protein involved in Fe transport [Janthinobacterium sp. K2C7]MBB5382747.1 outer membrane receptor protein involved in Fe transport [Janthinobacterium sp. K2Li3]MBB5384732.1 outer membrane receptor protein involved in Fe transport [Janthinobacterium sp. K2E3]